MEPLLAGLPACVRLRLHGVKVSETQGPLMLTLDGPQRLCGQVSLHGAGRIEARFAVRKAGQYALTVCESETGRALLRDLLDVLAGVAHTASETTTRFVDKIPFDARRVRLTSRAPRVGAAARAPRVDGMIRIASLASDAVVARACVTNANASSDRRRARGAFVSIEF